MTTLLVAQTVTTAVFAPNFLTISTSEGAPYGDCDFWVQAPSACINRSNFGYGPTKVIRLYICLSGEVAVVSACSQQPTVTGPLSQTTVNKINAGIAAYRGTGIRLIVRFIYNFGPIGMRDAPLPVILAHLDQVAPVLLQNRDLIFALQAGFAGTWGEWHDSTNGNDTAAAHKAILDKELSYFSGAFPILVRDPGILIAYTGTTVPHPALGIHDDYYASGPDDSFTWNPCAPFLGYCLADYSQAQMMSYGSAVATTTMFVGELAASLYPALQSCGPLHEYSMLFSPQSINLFPSLQVETFLQQQGCATSFFNRVGTRIVLQKAVIIGNPSPGVTLSLALTMLNGGYGRVIRARPARLVIIQGGHLVGQISIPIESMDLRILKAFSSETFQFDVALPATLAPGPTSLALLIPDPAPSLASDPAYALPLNSLDQNGSEIFDLNTGYNYLFGGAPLLARSFELDRAGSMTRDANEVVDGAYSIKGSYSGTDSFTPYLKTVPAVLPLTPNHPYSVTFRYKIITTPDKGFEVLFYSPKGGATGSFLPSFTITGNAGDSGTAALTNTLGPYDDYHARWTINGTGAISVDDIQIIDAVSGNVIARTDGEPALASPLSVLCNYALNPGGHGFSAQGGTGVVTITTTPGCPWSVSDVPPWITLTSPPSGIGSGTVTFRVGPNGSGSTSASLRIGGQAFTIEQAAATIPGLAAVGSLAHVASGGTWEFSLIASNLGTSPGTARFSFTDNNGRPLSMPFTFPQVPISGGPLLAATLDRTLNQNAQIVMESTGPESSATQIGAGQLLSSGSVGGFGIFSRPASHWNAVVPLETRNATKYILAFDNTSPLTTGVAVANLSPQAVNVSVTIRDDTGALIGNPTISLAPLGHTSFMLNDSLLGFSVTNNKRGTIEFNSPLGGQLSVLGLRANGAALTTLPVLADVGTTGGALTHVAYHGGWTSVFYLVNTSDTSAQLTLSFFDENGVPLPVPLRLPQSGTVTTTAALIQTLQAGAMLVVETQAQDSERLLVGSAQLATTTSRISGFEVFRWTTFGQEASVPLETRTPHSFVLLFDNTKDLTTGVALANTLATPVDITATFRDDSGAQIGNPTTISLPARGHTSFLLPERYPPASGKRGMVEFGTPPGTQMSAVGLRAKSDGTLTTIPLLTK